LISPSKQRQIRLIFCLHSNVGHPILSKPTERDKKSSRRIILFLDGLPMVWNGKLKSRRDGVTKVVDEFDFFDTPFDIPKWLALHDRQAADLNRIKFHVESARILSGERAGMMI
jgi:hypothetical protein